ncbi:hypothetical protein CBW65_03460 [Tumebacillus avium]|uniref:Major facilitator superfamily (MFS) profile domain-containing protein n=1 Tax=Tumebacillus avium TaxID=1903704 RepID=A0A1Y0IJG7_9BACL|nr:MFS transporter [Tumebacillus avium]ARU60219.1 hypothetical protein CBW65_03460 [Tumebacillus avium]
MRLRFTGLWRHRDFLKLWSAETISMFGSQITYLALPLIAALVLGATPTQMGILAAAGTVPYLLFGLFVGAWVDRLPRKPIMQIANLFRAGLLLTIPAAAYADVLTIGQLFLVVFLTGTATVFFDVASTSYLPSVIARVDLVEGNSKFEFTNSLSRITGPGLGGALVQLVTAPFAILVDVVGFLVSSLLLTFIRTKETVEQPQGGKQNIWGDIGEGLRVVFGSRILRPIILSTAVFNFCMSLIQPIFLLFITRDLGLAPTMIGLIFGMSGVGAMIGALLAGKLKQRFGVGPAIAWAILFTGISMLMKLFAVTLPTAGAVPLLMGAQIVDMIMIVIYNINQVSLRMAITPNRLHGRMNASIRFVVVGIMPLGALAGGLLGGVAGVFNTMIIGGVGIMLAACLILFSPVRKMREVPVAPEEAAA